MPPLDMNILKVLKCLQLVEKQKMKLMIKPNLSLFLIPIIIVCAGAPALGDDEPLSCADRSIVAHAVRTTEDIQAFVQCAYEFVQDVGFAESRRAFNEDERWKSGPT